MLKKMITFICDITQKYSIFTFPEIIEQNVITKNFRSIYKSNTLLNRKY